MIKTTTLNKADRVGRPLSDYTSETGGLSSILLLLDSSLPAAERPACDVKRFAQRANISSGVVHVSGARPRWSTVG